MKRIGIVAVAVFFALSAISLFAAGKQEESKVVLKAAYDFPTSAPAHAGMSAAAEYLDKTTGGKVQFQLFPNTWGTQQDSTMALLRGTLDIYHAGATWLAEYYPPIGAMEAPFLYRDMDHINKFRESPISRDLADGFAAKTNLRILNMWYLGIRQTLLNKPAKSPDDFKGVKLRVPQAAMYLETATVLGTTGTPIPINDVYMSLKTGIVDGTENPLVQIDNMKFWEVAKNLILTGHMVSFTMPVINKDSWNKVPKEFQPALIAALEEGRKVNDKTNLDGEASLLSKFKERGINIITPDQPAFRERAKYLSTKYAAQWGDFHSRIANLR